MATIPATHGGHNAFVMMSALQKHIRRGEEAQAAYAAFQFLMTDNATLRGMLMNRLIIISHEDIGMASPTCILVVATAVDQARAFIRAKKVGAAKLCVANVVMMMCRSLKSRSADHMQAVYAEGPIHAPELETSKYEVPDYVYDQHTTKGRKLNRGLEHFRTESTKLVPAPASPCPYEDSAFKVWAAKRETGA